MIVWGLAKILAQRRAAKAFATRPRGYFVFARITDAILPMERGAKYHRPLEKALRSRGFGYVVGAGTQMNRERSTVAWVGLDLELADLDGALVFARDKLRELGAPAGSTLEYRVGDDQKVMQIL